MLSEGGHQGPVSALALCPTHLFSGSWDYCVRVWDRHTTSATSPSLTCVQVVHFDDWVTDMWFVEDRKCLWVASGSEGHLMDAGEGSLRVISKFGSTTGTTAGGGFEGGVGREKESVTGVRATVDGRYMYCSTSHGGVYTYDVRMSPRTATIDSCFLSSSVTGLSFEYPWLTASLQNGEVVLIGNMSGGSTRGVVARSFAGGVGGGGWEGGGAQCVAIGSPWVVAGYEGGGVVSWDFSRAEEAERKAEALRAGRKKERERRREEAKEMARKKKEYNNRRGFLSSGASGSRVPSSPAVPVPIPVVPSQGQQQQHVGVSRSLPDRWSPEEDEEDCMTTTTAPTTRRRGMASSSGLRVHGPPSLQLLSNASHGGTGGANPSTTVRNEESWNLLSFGGGGGRTTMQRRKKGSGGRASGDLRSVVTVT